MTPLYLFLDTETTGLNPARDEMYDIAWVFEQRDIAAGPYWNAPMPGKGVVAQYYLKHYVPWDDVSEFTRSAVNYARWEQQTHRNVRDILDALNAAIHNYSRHQQGGESRPVHLVCANPSFDHSFMEAIMPMVYHYRKIDVECMAMDKWELDAPIGLEKIMHGLQDEGRAFRQAHDARSDVLALRQAFWALKGVKIG